MELQPTKKQKLESSLGKIQSLDKNSIKKLCSGQVVTSLSSMLKELIENSIDARATTIEIIFKEYGIETVSVSDNGIGISQENYEHICKPHHTSKIQTMDDISSLETLGFRGEALGSLASLADISIITKTKNEKIGNDLKFNGNELVSNKPTPREVGTTVIVKSLFKNLPVRHRELQKNIKKEFSKTITLIEQIALINDKIRFIVKNLVNGRKIENLTTMGRSLKENISSILGISVIQKLIPFNFKKENEFEFNGNISKAERGCGRCSKDQQYFYINKRPVDFSNASKLINGLYRTYNPHQYPIFILNINMNPNEFDINVAPDKRQAIMEEDNILDFLKNSLFEIWEPKELSYDLSEQELNSNLSTQDFNKEEKKEYMNEMEELEYLKQYHENKNKSTYGEILNLKMVSVSVKPADWPIKIQRSKNHELGNYKISSYYLTQKESLQDNKTNTTNESSSTSSQNESNNSSDDEEEEEEIKPSKRYSTFTINSSLNNDSLKYSQHSINQLSDSSLSSQEDNPINLFEIKIMNKSKELNEITMNSNQNKILEGLNKDIKNKSNSKSLFKSKIKKGNDEECEKELNRLIKRETFKEMKVIGQYNQAFIISQLKNDLFILDQHACDEKYNYETLFETTIINTQPLITPKKLNLSLEEEDIVIQNISIFEKYGFNFNIDLNGRIKERVWLKTVPFSKQTTFNENDVREMIFYLIENPNLSCRPSKFQKMFASRACRKSVMFGKDLSIQEMQKIVDNLSEIYLPWNCPHGRPTMRHLFDLQKLE